MCVSVCVCVCVCCSKVLDRTNKRFRILLNFHHILYQERLQFYPIFSHLSRVDLRRLIIIDIDITTYRPLKNNENEQNPKSEFSALYYYCSFKILLYVQLNKPHEYYCEGNEGY